MDFRYQTLQSNSLRLLKPLAISCEILAFTITHHPRTIVPAYTAVSYTWGDGAPTERIVVNGRTFYVRLNLWSCLYYLSNAASVENVLWTHLWIDAICIDQTNDRERNTQVRLMDQIYRNASTVSVWLGLPPLPELWREQLLDHHQPIKTYENDGFDWLESMEDLANRSYWTRFWAIQECLLGQEVHLYCGSSCVDWSFFKELLGRETGVHDYMSENVEYARSPSGTWSAWPLVTGRHPDKHPEFQRSLYQLLITHERSQCKDTRDRVFALLGLVTSDERHLLDRFFPDYTMAEDDVIIIALSHVELHVEQGPVDEKRLLLALGVGSGSRQKHLLSRAKVFDYLGDHPPAADHDEFYDEETSEGSEIENFGIPDWETILDTGHKTRTTCGAGLIIFAFGAIILLLILLEVYQPRVLDILGPAVLREIGL